MKETREGERDRNFSSPRPGTGASSAESSGRLKFDYCAASGPREMSLDQYGEEGWELVSALPIAGDQAIFYFKRKRH